MKGRFTGKGNNDLLIWLQRKGAPALRAGDVVIFARRDLLGEPINACKRIAAAGGERVKRISAGTQIDIWVPPCHLWVRGDSSENSLDSEIYGCIPQQQVWGRALYLFSERKWPVRLARIVESRATDNGSAAKGEGS